MMWVYHGAACVVQNPIVGHGRSDLDFGQGFYVTSLREQVLLCHNRSRKEAGHAERSPFVE